MLTQPSKNAHSRCHKCGKNATKGNGTAPKRKIRHLSVFDTPVYLIITPIRYLCENCDTTTTEQYDWCERNASITNKLADYLMRSLINSTIEDVSKKYAISVKIIQTALDRQINQTADWSDIHDLNTIGIDEISLKKGHQDYVAIVSAKSADKLMVIGVLKDRTKETVKKFLTSIPLRLRSTVTSVCTDMYDGFVSAAVEVFGIQALVIDRYHLAKLYRKPLDRVRIKEMQRIKRTIDKEEYAELKGVMWILRKQHECLTEADKSKLELLYQYSPQLKRAHTYALKLTHIFNAKTSRKSALAKIDRWINTVEHSDMRCFTQFITCLKKYKPYIANYFKSRKSSGFVEGLNNKIKVAKRRCYGIVKTESLFQRLFLDLRGYEVYA